MVTLSACDIPGAELTEPLDKHPVVALRWWLLCGGIKVPTSVRKNDLIHRLAIAILNMMKNRVRKVVCLLLM